MKNLPKIALGAWSWGTGTVGGDQVFGNHLEEKDLKPIFDAAMENGLNLWDTATVYGMGASEDILGSFVRGAKREEVILSTKFTPQIAGMYGESMEKMADASMKRLGVDVIDIYWIHNPADVERWTPALVPLLKSGKVKSVGVSNHSLAELKRANAILQESGCKVEAVQNHFSLLNRSSESSGILDYCKENGIVFFAYMVLEQGALSGKYDTEHPFPDGSDRAKSYNPILPQLTELVAAMKEIGEAHGLSVAQVGTAWAIAKGTLPIIGVTKVRHVEDAVKAASITLTPEEIMRLENLADKANVSTIREWEKKMD
ncbi:MAG: aldo/keto reductase [Selenomonadaceae bacterium]|nr:aldo/keto reductase [Selenomonadaceae bacterium]